MDFLKFSRIGVLVSYRVAYRGFISPSKTPPREEENHQEEKQETTGRTKQQESLLFF
jgi:hypothetical protein